MPDTRTFVQMARLKGDHRSALGANHFNRSFCRGDVHVATDDRRILSSEFQNNVRSTPWCGPEHRHGGDCPLNADLASP